jgi:hypothetical protein
MLAPHPYMVIWLSKLYYHVTRYLNYANLGSHDHMITGACSQGDFVRGTFAVVKCAAKWPIKGPVTRMPHPRPATSHARAPSPRPRPAPSPAPTWGNPSRLPDPTHIRSLVGRPIRTTSEFPRTLSFLA